MWLLKTEPGTYSYEDLEREGRAVWDGVNNPVALKNLRAMKAGDRASSTTRGTRARWWAGRKWCERPIRIRRRTTRLVVVDLKPAGRLSRP